MKVVALVNGLITAEVAALYALRYARTHVFPLSLLHVRNPADSRSEVEKSMAVIEEEAEEVGVKTERVLLDGHPARSIAAFLAGIKADTLFCGTRMRGRLFEDSLSEKLTRLTLPVDIVVVRVVHVGGVAATDHILLPIREDRLSVEKFVFLASLTLAYEAAAEIYSITVVSRRRLADLEITSTRELFTRINTRLAHYLKLGQHLSLPLRIKHAIATNEVDQLLHHLAHHDFQLMVIGGQRLSRFPRLFGEKPIERLFRHTPVNTIALYPREQR
jgi:nucleotide-binding universal stress UspA family protein